MSDKTIRVLIKEPGKDLEQRLIIPTLDTLQSIVGGWIEFTKLTPSRNIDIICNEEGKILFMPNNFYVEWLDDVIVGPVIFVRNDGYGGTEGLTDEDVEYIKKYIDNTITWNENGGIER